MFNSFSNMLFDGFKYNSSDDLSVVEKYSHLKIAIIPCQNIQLVMVILHHFFKKNNNI